MEFTYSGCPFLLATLSHINLTRPSRRILKWGLQCVMDFFSSHSTVLVNLRISAGATYHLSSKIRRMVKCWKNKDVCASLGRTEIKSCELLLTLCWAGRVDGICNGIIWKEMRVKSEYILRLPHEYLR